MMSRHYAPKARLELSTFQTEERIRYLIDNGEKTAWLTIQQLYSPISGCNIVNMPGNADEYAHQLFAVLHEMDRLGCSVIVVDSPPDGEEWDAIRDRLARAAAIKEQAGI